MDTLIIMLHIILSITVFPMLMKKSGWGRSSIVFAAIISLLATPMSVIFPIISAFVGFVPVWAFFKILGIPRDM